MAGPSTLSRKCRVAGVCRGSRRDKLSDRLLDNMVSKWSLGGKEKFVAVRFGAKTAIELADLCCGKLAGIPASWTGGFERACGVLTGALLVALLVKFWRGKRLVRH